MTYQLAKKLKDAGFPQGNTVITNNEKCDNPDCLRGHEAMYCHSAYAPALSELIEACRDGFRELVRDTSTSEIIWECNVYADVDEKIEPNSWTEGNTPEEAVANLWLELNKKQSI